MEKKKKSDLFSFFYTKESPFSTAFSVPFFPFIAQKLTGVFVANTATVGKVWKEVNDYMSFEMKHE